MKDKPNILLILTDQHRLSAVNCYGNTPCRTPNFNRLADEGVRFETAYTCCPVCSPVRASIMTGLYPHAHGICSNVHNLGSSVHELADRPELLSRRLQAAGYACGYTGKWHLGTDSKTCFGQPNTPSLPRDVGFDGQNFPGHGGGGFNYPEYKAYLADNGFTHEFEPAGLRSLKHCGTLKGPIESTVPYFLAENSIKLMQGYKEQNQPFFVWHNFWGPHGPYLAPGEFVDMYRDTEIPPWPNAQWDERHENRPHQVKLHPEADDLQWEEWAEALRYYYAFTSLIDDQVGRMLDYLDRSGLAENTIVIFTADHGETAGSHGGLTDKGWHHFEETHRIPFIVRMPEKMRNIDPGSVLQQWISNLDLYPSILDFAGVEYDPSTIHGKSISPLIRGKSIDLRDTIFTEFNGVNSLATNMITCRYGNIKYGWNVCSFDELYDLGKDPHEMHNRIDDPEYAQVAGDMRERIVEFMQQSGYPGLGIGLLRSEKFIA